VALKVQPPISVHQCLFGYKDGHRLLASSIGLPGGLISLLLVLSDFAPGLSFSDVDAYWTGLPLPGAKYYALMRTWPAPEMPRPGCVWTHVLLIAYADIPRFIDLGVLAKVVRRPGMMENFDSYCQPLRLNLALWEDARFTDQLRPIATDEILHVIRALYSSSRPVVLLSSPGALDEAIFAAWSQQWPRLRRTFTFRTAVSLNDSANLGVQFDLCVALGQEVSPKKTASLVEAEAWEIISFEDLRCRQLTAFRRFLWRYGSDIRKGRRCFRLLAEVYLATRAASVSADQLTHIIEEVVRALPSPDEARLLKEDLISCGDNQYSLLPPSDPLGILEFFVSHPEEVALPALPTEALTALDGLWLSRSDEILSILNLSLERQSSLSEDLLSRIARLIDSDVFLKETAQRPRLRRQLLRAKPQLLDSEKIAGLPPAEISSLVEFIPEDELSLASRIIQRLLVVSDSLLATKVFDRFSEVTIRLMVNTVERLGEGFRLAVGEAWIKVLADKKYEFLCGGFIQSASSTTALAVFADILGYDSPEVLDMGPLPWAAGLHNARDDVRGQSRQVFLVFILMISIVRPRKGCEPMLERSFESVHRDIGKSALPHVAYDILGRCVPEISWWLQWDMCLRLRTAVVNAYIKGELDLQSFRRLTSDQHIFSQLVDLANGTKRGQRFIKQLAARPVSGKR